MIGRLVQYQDVWLADERFNDGQPFPPATGKALRRRVEFIESCAPCYFTKMTLAVSGRCCASSHRLFERSSDRRTGRKLRFLLHIGRARILPPRNGARVRFLLASK